MHIIFGQDNAIEFAKKYTVLELDTFIMGTNGPVEPAYCVVEIIPITDIPQMDSKLRLHENLMVNYKKQDWRFCIDAITHLKGFWNGELDTFYEDLFTRICDYQQQDPGPDWSPYIQK